MEQTRGDHQQTMRRKLAAELQKLKLIPAVLDKVPSGILFISTDMEVVYHNQAVRKIFSLSDTQLLQSIQITDLFNPESANIILDAIESSREISQIRLIARSPDSKPVTLCGSITPAQLDDFHFSGIVLIVKDLTEISNIVESDPLCKGCFYGIAGISPAMQRIIAQLPSISASDVPVLITGESGTGKELFAEVIHKMSAKSRGPFVPINCAAIPDTLIESELFGYKRGAFTDAKRDKKGILETANNGTLFLDEIGNASPAFQVKLLRILQDGCFTPLGSLTPVDVNVRFIAATNADLSELIRDKQFRSDLFYRLAVIHFTLPPLRERRRDIPALIEVILDKIRKRTSKSITGLTLNAMKALYDYDYPGNIRELENILERAFALCNSTKIDTCHLPDSIFKSNPAQNTPPSDTLPLPLNSGDETEQDRLLRILNENHWSKKRTAKALGIHRTTLYRKMKKMGLAT